MGTRIRIPYGIPINEPPSGGFPLAIMRTFKIKEYVDPYNLLPTGHLYLDGIDTGIKYSLDTKYHVSLLPKIDQDRILEEAVVDSTHVISINIPDVTKEELVQLQAILKNVLM